MKSSVCYQGSGKLVLNPPQVENEVHTTLTATAFLLDKQSEGKEHPAGTTHTLWLWLYTEITQGMEHRRSLWVMGLCP